MNWIDQKIYIYLKKFDIFENFPSEILYISTIVYTWNCINIWNLNVFENLDTSQNLDVVDNFDIIKICKKLKEKNIKLLPIGITDTFHNSNDKEIMHIYHSIISKITNGIALNASKISLNLLDKFISNILFLISLCLDFCQGSSLKHTLFLLPEYFLIWDISFIV